MTLSKTWRALQQASQCAHIWGFEHEHLSRERSPDPPNKEICSGTADSYIWTSYKLAWSRAFTLSMSECILLGGECSVGPASAFTVITLYANAFTDSSRSRQLVPGSRLSTYAVLLRTYSPARCPAVERRWEIRTTHTFVRSMRSVNLRS